MVAATEVGAGRELYAYPDQLDTLNPFCKVRNLLFELRDFGWQRFLLFLFTNSVFGCLVLFVLRGHVSISRGSLAKGAFGSTY